MIMNNIEIGIMKMLRVKTMNSQKEFTKMSTRINVMEMNLKTMRKIATKWKSSKDHVIIFSFIFKYTKITVIFEVNEKPTKN